MEKPKKSMFRFSNTALWSFVSMVLGAILGLVIPDVMIDLAFIGDIWIDAIKMMLIPSLVMQPSTGALFQLLLTVNGTSVSLIIDDAGYKLDGMVL